MCLCTRTCVPTLFNLVLLTWEIHRVFPIFLSCANRMFSQVFNQLLVYLSTVLATYPSEVRQPPARVCRILAPVASVGSLAVPFVQTETRSSSSPFSPQDGQRTRRLNYFNVFAGAKLPNVRTRTDATATGTLWVTERAGS